MVRFYATSNRYLLPTARMTLLRLFSVLSHLPLWLLHALGWLVGWLAWLVSPTYRRRLADHAARAGLSAAERRASVGEAGKLVMELPRLWMGAPVPVGWQGAALIEAAHAHGEGIVFLTPHLGCFEITARAYAERFGRQGRPITVLYRPPRQSWLQPVVDRSRACDGMATAPTTLAGVKQLARALKDGGAVGLLPDQVPPLGLGVWAPFFGAQAYTMTLAGRLAQAPGTRVLVAWGERLAWGRGYVVHVRPLPEPLPADAAGAAAVVNRAMEALVRECPSQYLWGYHRYKQPRKGF